ncbi:hypothetical protein PHAVU_003G185700 [Phaseolus vulgaris]|uniref:Uncharacterized protein n=1 Tax=Phaseolus vulgaris TaxID=3885 RepID=V7CAN6_PHAVU|nr:hypothetical protein PHAVU_003G185700g [Phaseolus vulgaris]XP_007155249.1 hypothetical protein PHAVU_003G185700g [Phaseolus vulgaris]ESW27242.1 hypothetical protein PHAVU_003G185700g [Phaseolus vulgaris]ESW27243.1 hypothetical protein PHAVU_003G185700g [Phaseolus vulgaris]
METLESAPSTPSRTTDSKHQTPSPLPPSVLRLWRPHAQRNLRNQWSQLASCKNRWFSASSAGRSHATALVNSHLSQRYMPDMKLGVVSDMPGIRKRACLKLFKRQELQRSKLLVCYKDMVGIVSDMINISRSLKCFSKGSTSSPLLQFSYNSADQSDGGDGGDGGGIPVFTFYSITSHEKFAEELVQMFSLELCLKRLLVLEFMSIGYDTSEVKQLHWSTHLYDDEFKDLRDCNLYCEVTHGPVPPRFRDGKSDIASLRFDNQPNPEVLQVYLTTWLADANIDTLKVNEIFTVVGEEMHVSII